MHTSDKLGTGQNIGALAGRLLLAALFLPAGFAKLTGFQGTVGYIASVGLPLPTLGAVMALVVEILGSLALIAGAGTRIASLVLAVGADANLSHRADLNLSQGWKPVLC